MEEEAAAGAVGLLAMGMGMLLCWGAFVLGMYAFMWWKVFTKANQPGWASLVPFYNIYCLLQVAGRPGWWLVLMLIPLVNIVVAIIVSIDVARRFGRGGGTAVGLILLPIVFYPILGFGSATWTPPAKPAA